MMTRPDRWPAGGRRRIPHTHFSTSLWTAWYSHISIQLTVSPVPKTITSYSSSILWDWWKFCHVNRSKYDKYSTDFQFQQEDDEDGHQPNAEVDWRFLRTKSSPFAISFSTIFKVISGLSLLSDGRELYDITIYALTWLTLAKSTKSDF